MTPNVLTVASNAPVTEAAPITSPADAHAPDLLCGMRSALEWARRCDLRRTPAARPGEARKRVGVFSAFSDARSMRAVGTG
jgi:hypothetical protein